MKIFCCIGLLLFYVCGLYAIDEQLLIQKIDEQNAEEIIQLFEDSKDITLKEAKEFLHRIYNHYNHPFEKKISRSDQEEIVDFITNTYLISFAVFGINIKDSFLRHYKNPQSHPFSIDELHYIFTKNNPFDVDMPESIVLGGTEILIGALVWILPYPGTKYIGGILIGDGITRAFHGLEEVDRRNKLAKLIK